MRYISKLIKFILLIDQLNYSSRCFLERGNMVYEDGLSLQLHVVVQMALPEIIEPQQLFKGEEETATHHETMNDEIRKR